MAPSPADDRPPVRDNQTLDAEGLRQKCADYVEASPLTQGQIGALLEPPVTGGAVSRAVSPHEPAGKYAPLQARIIAALSDYTVEDETRPVWRVRKKKGADDTARA